MNTNGPELEVALRYAYWKIYEATGVRIRGFVVAETVLESLKRHVFEETKVRPPSGPLELQDGGITFYVSASPSP